MKTYTAGEGYLFELRGQFLGSLLYTPDDFDESELKQVKKPEDPPVE
jgi:hypothetical protein